MLDNENVNNHNRGKCKSCVGCLQRTWTRWIRLKVYVRDKVEFAENGKLSDKAFVELDKAGIPREFVEAYIQGQEAISTASALEIQESIGGNANYAAMSEWAGENLADGDLQAYNAIVEKGTVEQARVAVKGMYAQFLAAGGKAPNLAQGATSGAAGAKAFGSAASMVEAMQDPRYKNDPAYREQIEKRIAVSNAF